MTEWFLDEIVSARRSRSRCALVTVAATRGSVPRAAGSKMLVYADGTSSGTVGGGKFESLVVEQAIEQIRTKMPLLKAYPLHETSKESFGAICGGEVTVLIEPQILNEALFLVGGGHCAQAIATLALQCGLFVTVVEDRADLIPAFPSGIAAVTDVAPSKFIAGRTWQSDEALVIVSRNYAIDGEALAAAIETTGYGYIGMIGSQRKVQHVFAQLRERGISQDQLAQVYAPIGLDIGADSPAEIAVSVIAEVLTVLRKGSGLHLRNGPAAK